MKYLRSRNNKISLLLLAIAVLIFIGYKMFRSIMSTTQYIPLLEAAAKGDKTTVERLLAAGADPNMSFGGGTALEAAKSNGHNDIVEILKNAGAKK